MAAKYSSSTDQDTLSSQNEIQLCPIDQKKPGSCTSPSCYNLHICRDYLLKNKCSEFESNGKCSYSHSLFTRQNQRILDKKLHLSAKDRDTFEKVSRLIQTSKSNSSEKLSSRSSHIDDDREFESTDNQTSTMNNGRGRGQSSTLPRQSSVDFRRISSDHPTVAGAGRVSISPRLSLLTNSDYSQKSLSNSERFSTSLSLDVTDRHRDRQGDDQSKSSTMHSLGVYDTDENNNTSSTAASSSRSGRFFKSAARTFVSMVKDIIPNKPDPNDTVRTDPRLKYVFDKFDRDDQLSFLHGPGRRYLVENGYQIFSSGYYRLANADQEKEIQDKLNRKLAIRLKTDRVRLPHDDFAFFMCTSAAEKIFEQNQITYSIISEPYSAPLSIEVTRLPKDDRPRSSSAPSRKIISARLPNDRETPRLSTPDGKFRIPRTNSSIDIIRDDITSVPVDLMVCVTTSATLLNSVLTKAGRSVISEFGRRTSTSKPVLLKGGSTSARQILFVPWELEVESSNSTKAQKSLSDLVKRCIDEAHKLTMTSISFPSIGTGKIGLDPDKVCESMISAASERLHLYKMDVLFVIYPSSRSDDPNEKSYQIFRSYLDGLCRQSTPTKAEASSIARSPRGLTIPVEKSQKIQRDGECKRISTVSDSSDTTFDHRQLLKSLERLIVEKTFDLSLVQQPFRDEVESLIDLCLDYHVLPRIDFVKGNLTFRGDLDSCSQCFFNLQNKKKVYKYGIYKKPAKNYDAINLNMYISMKINEAVVNNESDIRIEDGDKTVFRIDLYNSKIQINDDVQRFELYQEQLNADSKIVPPSSWSSSLMIRTIDTSLSTSDSKKCLRLFERTMPKSEWHVERIDAIENWPLYVHCNRTKIKEEVFAFHGCSYSSVQSIIHYGLHSNSGQSSENSIHLNYDAFDGHVQNARRSTDGKYYMFIVRLEKKLIDNGFAKLSNDTAHLALPTHLFVYRHRREIIA